MRVCARFLSMNSQRGISAILIIVINTKHELVQITAMKSGRVSEWHFNSIQSFVWKVFSLFLLSLSLSSNLLRDVAVRNTMKWWLHVYSHSRISCHIACFVANVVCFICFVFASITCNSCSYVFDITCLSTIQTPKTVPKCKFQEWWTMHI